MRTAIVHYWLVNQRGGEAVLQSLCKLLPDADIFTLFYDPRKAAPVFAQRNVKTSFLDPLRRWHRHLLPLMPMALEAFDLSGYDLVVSSESGPAKGVLVPADARHICYCHTPMRYLWELYPDYLHRWTRSRVKRAMMMPLTNYLRLWDYASAARVDEFIANSENVRRRIQRCYRRPAEVIPPPVAVGGFYWRESRDYYLAVSELVPYKRLECAVEAFSRMGRRLKIVGDGPEYRRLRAMAGATIEFCGRVSDAELRELYAGCRTLVMPGEEDFGITPVEAMASGKPVIAWGRGGVLETAGLAEDLGCVLYEDGSAAGLAAAVEAFEAGESKVRPVMLQNIAERFSEAEFLRRMGSVLAYQEFRPLSTTDTVRASTRK